MNKKGLVDNVAAKTGFTKKDSEKAVDAFLESVEETLIGGEDVKLTGHFSFEVSERKSRKGRNPATGEEITIPATKYVKFKAGKELKEAVAGS